MTDTEVLARAERAIQHEAWRHTPPVPCDHDDLVQEARLAFLRRWRRGVIPEADIGPYATMITRSTIIDLHRAQRNGFRKGRELETVSLDHGADDGTPLAERVADPHATIDATRIDVHRALHRLPTRTRLAVQARMCGYMNSETGPRFGVTESRVCQLLAKARPRLTRLLDLDDAA